MATTNKATWQNMASKLKAMGGVSDAGIGEPPSAPASGYVAIIPESGFIPETTLGAPREIHRITLRRYESWLQEPRENNELVIDSWRAEILEDVFGDFDLGGTVAYAIPTETSWEYGYQTVGQTMFRLLDISIAYRVDDRATFVA